MDKVQEAAKEKIRNLIEKYDVSYIDYNARDDEYTINLEKNIEEE